MSKTKYYDIEGMSIVDAGSEGKAVGKVNGLTVFVPFAVPGDVVDAKVYKQRKGYAEAHLLRVVEKSPDRIEPVCSHFGLCGGCKWQAMNYQKQLEYKKKQVSDNFAHLGKFEYPPLLPIIPSVKEYYYRNKLEFTFTNLRWLNDTDMAARDAGKEIETRGLGFHIPGKFDKVLDINHCYLQGDPSNEIRLFVKAYAFEHDLPFYNVRTHEGLLRNLIIRSTSIGEWMVIVVFGKESETIQPFMEEMGKQFPDITSLQYVINTKLNDTITDLPIHLYKGKSYITEKMEELSFKIGPVSFYQTNSEQAYNLYKITREFADITQNDIVYDLYTGTGTIANFVATRAKRVTGIEYVDAAVEDARENSTLNHITNTSFFAGDMAKILTGDFIRAQGSPDIVIADPPRAGMHLRVIEQLLQAAPKRIVYVSCNPATQARDITFLANKYRVTKVQPVDMFPQTQHVENVTLLELK